jgi:uncharacterized protein YgbK (DUF1537 family)
MPSDRIIAIADDLTGAAEIAAIGHRVGWRAEVITRWAEPAANALTVIDTDTRLAASDVAGRALSGIGRSLAGIEYDFIFKKTDSVLRGPVLSEVTSLATALGRRAVLLVPANPSLGRVIRDGKYFVDDVPLDRTVFAHDPHHPAHTAEVAHLLGGGAVSVREPHEELPRSGIVVGATSTREDIVAWARRLDDSMLAAGGRDFFTAAIETRGFAREPASSAFAPGSPTLLVRGSLASATRILHALQLPPNVVAGDDTELGPWIKRVLATLATDNFAAVECAPADGDQAPARIRAAFAALVHRAVDAKAVRHVMVEGGATASSILNILGWNRLLVAREWAPGIVTLRPAVDDGIAVTLKPGSYAWPDALWAHVANPALTINV